MYDINKFAGRLKELRKTRWRQYKEYQKAVNDKILEKQKENERFKKYAFCKSQESFADKLQIERRSIVRWENGDKPTIENIIEICNALDCSIDYLLGSGDVPDADPISKAAKYSGVSPEIIRYGKENPDYLDCLNFFMLPQNCKSLFNSITLSTWKKYWINSILVKIKSPLKDQLIKLFTEYNAITPFSEINKENFKNLLKSKFPEKELMVSQETSTGVKIETCFDLLVYQSFFDNGQFDYEKFITYITDNTFEPLSYNAMIEIQKTKLANFFVALFTKYLEELEQ